MWANGWCYDAKKAAKGKSERKVYDGYHMKGPVGRLPLARFSKKVTDDDRLNTAPADLPSFGVFEDEHPGLERVVEMLRSVPRGNITLTPYRPSKKKRKKKQEGGSTHRTSGRI